MNKLYYGDNLDVLRKFVRDETVDLCYIDRRLIPSAITIRFTTTSGRKIAHRRRRLLIRGRGTVTIP